MYLGVDEVETTLFDGESGAVDFDQRRSTLRGVAEFPRRVKTQFVARGDFSCTRITRKPLASSSPTVSISS